MSIVAIQTSPFVPYDKKKIVDEKPVSQTFDRIKKIALGALVCVIQLPIAIWLGKSISSRLSGSEIGQDLTKIIKSSPSGSLQSRLLLGYITVGGPILEERIIGKI